MQISRNSLTLLVGAAASAMILSACGGGSSTPAPQAQAALTVAAVSTALTTGGTTNLSTTGGSGSGAVTFQATGGCTVSGAVLTAPASDATCTVTATKAADGSTFLQATSTNTLTITVTVPTTTFLTFDETTAPTLTAFSSAGTMAATIETDPAVSTNKVVKLVKSANSDTWAGATVSKCAYPTNALPVIPLSATNKKMSLRVYSTVANKVVRLKLEDASDNTHTVETEATVTAANTWQTLTFDFGSVATGTAAWNAAFTYNKASVFPDFGATAASTMYIDDLKFIGVANVAQTCMTAPTGPTASAATPAKTDVVAIYSDAAGYSSPAGLDFPDWGDTTVPSDFMIGSSDHTVRLATINYQGITWTNALDLSTYTNLHVDFWSADAVAVDVCLISLNPTTEACTTINVAANQWTSSDKLMSSISGPNKSAIAQIKLVATPVGKTVYMDNLYFWK